MRCAVVDVGSNTIRMNIYDIVDSKNKKIKKILSDKETLGLTNYVHDGFLNSHGMERLRDVLRDFQDMAESVQCDSFNCFATATLRNILNTRDAVEYVENSLGIRIEVLSGEEEALLSFAGIKYRFDAKNGSVIDMGGGSTELVGFQDGRAMKYVSLPFGCLELYKLFVRDLFPKKREYREIQKEVLKHLMRIGWLRNYNSEIYLVGGTGRAIAKLHKEVNHVTEHGLNGYTMTVEQLEELYEYCTQVESEQIKLFTTVIVERMHTILPGFLALLEICKSMGAKTVTVSSVGIREGYVVEKILGDD